MRLRRRGEASSSEHGAAHEVGEALDGSVGVLVGGEISAVEGFAEGERLTEAEAEAFAGDGVDGAGGVADEGDVAAGDAMELAAESDGAARGIGGSGGAGDAAGVGGSGSGRCRRWGILWGDEGYADLVRGDGGDVGLAVVAPVDFDEVGWSGLVSIAKCWRRPMRCGAGGGSVE